jgi:ferritin-like metal-binding protein YciE
VLRDELQKHAAQARGQLERLERVFELMDAPPVRKHCNAMAGLLSEGECLLAEGTQEAVRDSTILAIAQKIEHYEIATYVTLREWAQQLGRIEVSGLLQQTLDEEIASDEKLSQLALTLNNKAAHAG